MKDKLLSFVVLPSIMFALFLAFSPVGRVEAQAEKNREICHARSAHSNPYGPKKEYVDDDSIVGDSGHDGHNGPVWFEGITESWGDIIKPFDYGDGQHYAGKNWTTEGQAIFNNNCQPVVVAIRSDFNLTSMCRPSETEGRLRVRNQSDYDYPYVLTLYGTDTKFNGTAPADTDTLVDVPWTDSSNTWILEIAGFSFRKAIGNNALCVPVMCKWDGELEADDPACPVDCQYDATISSIDESCKAPVMCKWDGELEADDPACPVDCQYDSTISSIDPLCAPKDDDPDTEGVQDDTTKKDTGVVLAATGPTDNTVVYMVELLLVAMLVTYSVFFTKTYLKNSK
ncbi:MAG TPA: hypothetical protein PKI16_02825 [Candidatus Dojkabacteria bacterium]|nr:hypothetical protein [Candidatus Dojkabacteria bacterium]